MIINFKLLFPSQNSNNGFKKEKNQNKNLINFSFSNKKKQTYICLKAKYDKLVKLIVVIIVLFIF